MISRTIEERFIEPDYSRLSVSIDGEESNFVWPHAGLKDPIGANIRLNREIEEVAREMPNIYGAEDYDDRNLGLENRFVNLSLELNEMTAAYGHAFQKWQDGKLILKILRNFILVLLEIVATVGIYCILTANRGAGIAIMQDFANWWLAGAVLLIIIYTMAALGVYLLKTKAAVSRKEVIKLLAFYYKNVDTATRYHNVLHERPIYVALAELLTDDIP